jgi:murein DD-endopeptidase MepM/ murein hydrolase activator NlpD
MPMLPLLDDHDEAPAHRPVRRARVAAVLAALAVFATVGAVAAQVGRSDTSAGTAAPRLAVNAEALGALVLRPDHEPLRLAASQPVVGVAASAQGAQAAWQLDGIASIERATSGARVATGRRTSAARVSLAAVDLLDGRIRIENARIDASAGVADGRASGAIAIDPATTLRVDGVERPLRVNERIAVEGVGTVIVNEQAVVANAPTGDAQTGPRYRTVGALLHLRIAQSYAGLEPGSEVVIGRVDAGVREGVVRKVAHDEPGVVVQPATPGSIAHSIQTGTPKPGESALPRHSTTVRGSEAGSAGPAFAGYLFPVLGSSNYTDTWGAARASTGIPHQGTDIFAEEGTPIVAVADGVLDRVGWNTIGGYRFWLFDEYGNSFYHAHLSAYSPLAIDGAHVKRGDVIGFVGHTGDAQYTPPHLHFEVHPGNGDAVNPYQILNAWRHGVAVAIGLMTSGAERTAPLALLNFTDISSSSGLEADVLAAVPDTHARSIEHENDPRPTDESLKGAIDGPATSPRR